MKILIAAGGTGGHIWPALSFRDWIQRKGISAETLFLSGSRELEEELYASAGVAPVALPIAGSPLWGPLGTRISRAIGLARSLKVVLQVIRDFSPDICLLFGGYVSVAAMAASRLRGLPLLLHEQNARAGRVTSLAARIGIPVCSGWEICEPLPAGRYLPVGIPVRRLRRLAPREAWERLGYGLDLPPGPRILVLGGSMGSDPMAGLFRELSGEEPFRDYNFFVVGSSVDPVRVADNLLFLPRVWEIDLLYSIADVVISRAGASTLAELVAFGLPSVIIPWRAAADDHQASNARVFAQKGFGTVWEYGGDTHEKLSFMIDYELKKARHGQASPFPGMQTSEASEKIWVLLQQIAEGRGRN